MLSHHSLLLWVFNRIWRSYKSGPLQKWVFLYLSPDVISHVKCPNRWKNDPFSLRVMDIDCFLLKNGRLMLLLSPQYRFCWEVKFIFSCSEPETKKLLPRYLLGLYKLNHGIIQIEPGVWIFTDYMSIVNSLPKGCSV